MLKERIAGEEKIPEVSAVWRASEVGECETYLCRVRLGHKSLPFTGRIRHMLSDGVTHEHDIVDRLRAAGIGVLHSYVEGQAEMRCLDSPLVRGHPDGVLDVPLNNEFTLDYSDEKFAPSRFMLLEITAPNHFAFLRIKRDHLRETLWRKFVQIQMYLNSEEMRSYGNCAVTIVKNKNTSELYEEGTSLDVTIIEGVKEKLKKVEDLVSKDKVADFRCADWRSRYCRYRHLCFSEEEPTVVTTDELLKGESLREVEVLRDAAKLWRKGKLLKLDGEDLIAESRDVFTEIVRQYECSGLTIDDVKALMIGAGVSRRTNYDLLRSAHPDVYDAVITESTRESYIRVSE